MKHTPRHTATQALLQMEENEGYSNIVIDKALRAAGLDARDAGLASTIFYGVLERRLPLEHFLRGCLANPQKKAGPPGVGAAAVRRLPDSLLGPRARFRRCQRGGGGGQGNQRGRLRGAGQRGAAQPGAEKSGPLPAPRGDSLQALSLRYSIPQELIALWQRSYGKELTAQLLEAFQRRAPLYLRINPLRATAEGLAASLGRQGVSLKPVESLPWAAVAEGEGSPASLEEFQEGLFHVQDLSAQLACSLLEAQPGQAVCDCCAAPGGKSFTLAEDMENTGSLHAFDLYKGRVGLIQQGAERLRLSCIQAGRKDASKPYEGLGPMDRVLCDVPCSGYGVIRRKPENPLQAPGHGPGAAPAPVCHFGKRRRFGKARRPAALRHLHLEPRGKRRGGLPVPPGAPGVRAGALLPARRHPPGGGAAPHHYTAACKRGLGRFLRRPLPQKRRLMNRELTDPRDIKSKTLPQLQEELAALGLPKYRAQQVYRWLHRGVTDFSQMSDLSPRPAGGLGPAVLHRLGPGGAQARLPGRHGEIPVPPARWGARGKRADALPPRNFHLHFHPGWV